MRGVVGIAGVIVALTGLTPDALAQAAPLEDAGTSRHSDAGSSSRSVARTPQDNDTGNSRDGDAGSVTGGVTQGKARRRDETPRDEDEDPGSRGATSQQTSRERAAKADAAVRGGALRRIPGPEEALSELPDAPGSDDPAAGSNSPAGAADAPAAGSAGSSPTREGSHVPQREPGARVRAGGARSELASPQKKPSTRRPRSRTQNQPEPAPWELVEDLLPVLPSGRSAGAMWLAAIAILAIVVTSLVRRARDSLPTSGMLPRFFAMTHTLLRLLVFGLLLALAAHLLPGWMGPALPWVLLAAAAALGWSARDVLPDVIAGVVLTFERRVQRGVWLSTADATGTVEGVGLRATWLRDARDHRVAVPNRRLLNAPLVSDRAVGAEHEITLRIESDARAASVRRALHDAVLMSPWIPPGAEPVVLRDADDPHLWHVRTRLLEARFASRLEGELLERAEDVLADEHARRGHGHSEQIVDVPETSVVGAPESGDKPPPQEPGRG